jgi:hypothetical protein
MVLRRPAGAPAPSAGTWPFLLAFLALALFPGVSRATPVLDQLASPDGGSFLQDNDLEPVQSFTVGQTGHLTEIDLWSTTTPAFQNCCELVLSTQFTPTADLVNGLPSDGAFFSSIVGQVDLLGNTNGGPIVQGWNAFVLPTPIPVTAGDVLYFTVIQDDDIEWGTSSYAGGAMVWLCFPDGCSDPANPGGPALQEGDVVFPSSDWAFRTFVPEPSPGWLLAVGALLGGALDPLGGLGLRGRGKGSGLRRDPQEAGLEAQDQGR